MTEYTVTFKTVTITAKSEKEALQLIKKDLELCIKEVTKRKASA